MPPELRVITLPKAFVDGPEPTIIVSVLLSPQLRTADNLKLSDFPMLEAGPAKLNPRVFLDVNKTRIGVAPRLPELVRAPEADATKLWSKLFPRSLRIGEYKVPDLKQLQSYDAAAVEELVKGSYAKLAPRPQNRAALLAALPAPQQLQPFTNFHKERTADPNCKEAQLDFHQALATVGQYPILLRRLGLLFDVKFKLTKKELQDMAAAPDPKLRIFWDGQGMNPAPTFPFTRYLLKKYAADAEWLFTSGNHDPARAEVSFGFAQFGTARYRHTCLDLVGAGLHLDTLRSQVQASVSDSTPSLPQLKSAGISLLHVGRAKTVSDKVSHSIQTVKRVEAAQADDSKMVSAVLDADDLTRGLAVDVRLDGEPNWRSLCSRSGEYDIGEGSIIIHDKDEGFVTVNATEFSDAKLLHESLFTWDGWSLVVPRPVKGVNPGKCAPGGTSTLPLKTTFKVDCPLPALKFGSRYFVRARAVDLAGNAVAVDDAKFFKQATEAATKSSILFLRYEPARAPSAHIEDEKPEWQPSTPAQEKKPRTGREVEAVVLRERDDITFYLAPPQVALSTYLFHGEVIDCDGDSVSKQLQETAARAAAADWAPGIARRKFPFFPDPVVKRIRIAGLPGNNAFNESITLDVRDNQGPKAVKVVVKSATKADYRVVGGVLELDWPKGLDRDLTVSSCIEKERLPHLGVWEWLSPADRAAIENEVTEGLNAAFNPPRKLRVAHAVKSPVRDPVIEKIDEGLSQRELGQTTSRLSLSMTVDVRSTGSATFEATSSEDWDDLDSEPKTVVRRYNLGRALFPPEKANTGTVEVVSPLGTTRYLHLDVKATAASRHAEMFPGEAKPRTTVDSKPWDAKSSAPPLAPVVAYLMPLSKWEDPDSRDSVKHTRRGGAVRVYFERPWFVSGNGESVGILCPTADTALDAVLKREAVTQWGLDPLWEQPARDFKSMRVAPEHIAGATALRDVKMSTRDGDVTVDVAVLPISLQKNFDAQKRLWFCDVRLEVPGALVPPLYFPFLRLAMVRVQPQALQTTRDLRFSPVVVADIAQLFPDRYVEVKRDGDTISVTLKGPFPVSGLKPAGGPEPTSHVVTAQLEINEGGDEELGWVAVTEETGLTPDDEGWGKKQWKVDTCHRTRLVVREYELLPGSSGPKTKRLVFFDIVRRF